MRRLLASASRAVVALGLTACSGSDSGAPPTAPVADDDPVAPGGPAAEPPAPVPEEFEPARDVAECLERSLPVQPLRRLSSQQYQNSLRDLFGPELSAPLLQGSLFPKTIIDSGFSGDAEANVINTAESNAIEDDAQRIASVILADPQPYLDALLGCPVSSPATDAEIDGCVGEFITDFGQRAYRRPLTEGEVARARGVFDAVRAEQTAGEAWAALVQYFVQAPAFLYRVESGVESPVPGLMQLDSWEMATRLSYLLRNSAPDAELFAAAGRDELRGVEQLLVHAERLMLSEEFHAAFAQFHSDWLHLYSLETLSKDAQLFPDFTDALRPSLAREAGELARHVLEGEGTVEALLSSSSLKVDAALAAFYGVTPPANGWALTEIPNRRGLLTQASFLASLAEPTRTNPIHRGGFFQTEILCNVLPAVPGNVDIQGPLEDTSMLPTARERLSPLLSRGDCAGCHQHINPIGLAFENYDAAGKWRDQENGTQIDASGSIDFGGGEVLFDDALQLIEAAAQSEQVRRCYSLQWYRAAMGRREFTEDRCSRAVVDEIASETGGNLRQILLAVIQTDAFRYRRAVEP